MNEWVEAVVKEAKKMLGWPYEMGGRGQLPDHGIDCRGLVQRAFRMAGCPESIGDGQTNVRAMVKWAMDNGRFRSSADVAPNECGRSWPVFYSGPGGAGPYDLRHVGIVLQPVSARYPRGRAISAVVPEVMTHRLALKGSDGLMFIFGYCEPAWPEPEPAITDPEDAVTLSAIDRAR